MDNCRIIEDLLPSYCDGLTGTESNELIQNHVASCSRCAALLNKMSAEPPREILDHREQFSRKLKEYERKHRAKVLAWTLGCIVTVLVLIILWTNSLRLAKWSADIQMDGRGTQIANNIPVDEYKIINYYIYHTNDGFQLVTLAKHRIWGIWYLDAVEKAKEDEILKTAWFGERSWSRFVRDADVEGESNFEINYLYIGNNATELLKLDYTEIPGDVCVKINQVQNSYWIWVITDNMDAANQEKVLEKLNLYPTN